MSWTQNFFRQINLKNEKIEKKEPTCLGNINLKLLNIK